MSARSAIGALSAFAATAGLCLSALAGDTTVRVGGATIRFDPARWKASVSENSAYFTAQGEAERELDPVALRTFSDSTPCAMLAERAFQVGHYDLSDIAPSPMTVGGVAGERFAAHTGCRNATPRGEIVCVKVGTSA
jgi:hypothetical protein